VTNARTETSVAVVFSTAAIQPLLLGALMNSGAAALLWYPPPVATDPLGQTMCSGPAIQEQLS
jgi:hypothetical protein